MTFTPPPTPTTQPRVRPLLTDAERAALINALGVKSRTQTPTQDRAEIKKAFTKLGTYLFAAALSAAFIAYFAMLSLGVIHHDITTHAPTLSYPATFILSFTTHQLIALFRKANTTNTTNTTSR